MRPREQASDSQTSPLIWYVYILERPDGDYYIGQTNELHVRLAEHELGGGASRRQRAATGWSGSIKRMTERPP